MRQDMSDIPIEDRMRARFVECDSCRAKPGSPLLCAGCIHNREVISFLKGAYKTLWDSAQNLTDNNISPDDDFMWGYAGRKQVER